MLKKVIRIIYLSISKNIVRYLLTTKAKKLKTSSLPHSDALYKSIMGVLEKRNKKISRAFNKIEKERLELSNNNSVLVDSTLDKPGIYDEGLTISEANKASKPMLACEFLGYLAFNTSPKTILELGTNTGISSSYLSVLLYNTSGFNLTTLDSSAHRQRIARTVHENLGIKNLHYITGLFSETLQQTLDSNTKWDLVFIDGHHQHQPTLDYFDMIYPYCNKNAIILFDDIRWSLGMLKAWEILKTDTRFLYCVDMYSVGIAILGNDKNMAPMTFYIFRNKITKLF